MRDEDMVDEFVLSVKDAGKPLGLWDKGCEVPEALGVAGVAAFVAGCSDFGAGRAVKDLGCRCFGSVVEIAGYDEGSCAPVSWEKVGDVAAWRRFRLRGGGGRRWRSGLAHARHAGRIGRLEM
ncbi:MAG: hypothetical protein ACRDQZ_22290 [Mycobacteriales bacterium]